MYSSWQFLWNDLQNWILKREKSRHTHTYTDLYGGRCKANGMQWNSHVSERARTHTHTNSHMHISIFDAVFNRFETPVERSWSRTRIRSINYQTAYSSLNWALCSIRRFVVGWSCFHVWLVDHSIAFTMTIRNTMALQSFTGAFYLINATLSARPNSQSTNWVIRRLAAHIPFPLFF